MIIVTGGAGFIGSNIVEALNLKGYTDIIVVDDLSDGHKFMNIQCAQIADYLDKSEFLQALVTNHTFAKEIDAVIHMGACSDTTEWNGQYVMENNFTYSKILFHYCQDHKIPFLYASSAAVYGNSVQFNEKGGHEAPLNVYGYSKYLFDQYVLKHHDASHRQVAGFRFFNVYGPKESHKGKMSSVAFHLNNQIQESGKVKLFDGYDGYGPGEQKRDFVYVGDIVKVIFWFLDSQVSGIFNLGTGRAQTFNDVARSVIAWHHKGQIEYIPFPEHLKGHYQSYTQADITLLRDVGCDVSFKSVEEGVKAYLDIMNPAISCVQPQEAMA